MIIKYYRRQYMRLPDPFTDPLAPGFFGVTITDNSTIIQDELQNNKVIQVDTGGHYWGIEIAYDQLLPEEYEIIRSFIFKAKATNSTIEVLLPQFENSTFTLDSYTVKSGLSGNSIVITNVTEINNQPVIGSIIKLQNHPKVYHITGYSYNSNTNEYTIDIYPKLARTTVSGDIAVINAVLFTTRLQDANQLTSVLTTDNVYDTFSIKLRESIA